MISEGALGAEIRCDSCGLLVAAVVRELRLQAPPGWSVEHRPGYSDGADRHFCPHCVFDLAPASERPRDLRGRRSCLRAHPRANERRDTPQG